jgi:hypothetical protein
MQEDFEGDAFISYAHLDNVELVEGRKGWVANLHRALEVSTTISARPASASGFVGSNAARMSANAVLPARP